MKLVDIGPGRRQAGEVAGAGAWGVGNHWCANKFKEHSAQAVEDMAEDSPQHPWQGVNLVASGLQNSWLSDYLASGAISLLPLAHYQHLTLLPQLLPPTLCLLLGKMSEPENAVFHLVSLSNVKLSVLVLCQLSKVTHSPFEHLSPFGA